MVLVKPTEDINGTTYSKISCGVEKGTTINICHIPIKNGQVQPTISKISTATNDTTIKENLSNVKIDLSALKDISKISGIYTVKFGQGVETSVYIKHAGGTHTLHIEGHQKLTQDLFMGSDSKELVEGLVTTKDTKDTTDFYNLLCGMQASKNKCVPVTIDGKTQPTAYLLNPGVSEHTNLYNSASEPFYFNLEKLVAVHRINQNDLIEPKINSKTGQVDHVEFQHDGKVAHTVIIETPNNMMTGLLQDSDTYVY